MRKNVQSTLAAYRLYLDRGGDPTVALVIAGRLPTADTPFFPDPQKTAADLHLTEQVHFCGFVDEADKPAVYALATAYIFPSLYEGFGMMVLEAMQAGTAVVTSEGVRRVKYHPFTPSPVHSPFGTKQSCSAPRAGWL